MEQIRCFIAIELPQELKAGLDRLQSELKSADRNWVKWVNPYGIHLTLKFLGNVPQSLTKEITTAMAAAAKGTSPFHLAVKDLGVFPNPRRVQVAWVGLSGETDKLAQLQQRIEANLEELGVAPEKRRFTPHLTLARLRDRVSNNEREEFGELITGTEFKNTYRFEVTELSLMRSQLSREGAIYSQISSVKLG